MIIPGIQDPSGNMYAVASIGPTPALFRGAFGFSPTNQLVIDTAAPVGNSFIPGGILANANGAIYGTTALDSAGPDQYKGGTRVSQLGQLVYEVNAVQIYDQRKGLRANGVLSVMTAAPP